MNTPLKPLGLVLGTQAEVDAFEAAQIDEQRYIASVMKKPAVGRSEDQMARLLAEDEEANSHGDDDDDEPGETLILRIQNAMLTDDADQSARLATLYADASDAGKELLNDAFVCLCGYTIPSLLEMGPNDEDTHVAAEPLQDFRQMRGVLRPSALDSVYMVLDRNEELACLAAQALAWHRGDIRDALAYVANDHAFNRETGVLVAGFLRGMLDTYDRAAFQLEWARR